MDDLENKVLISDLVEPEKGIVVARAFEPLSKAVVKRVSELGVKKIQIVDVSSDDGLIIRCMAKDPAHNEEEALKEIYKRLRPGDPPTPANARALVKRLFFDPKRYDLGRVGRYKMNQKLGLKGDDGSRTLMKEDLIEATKYLLRLKLGMAPSMILITWAVAASAPWASSWPTSAALAWPAPSAWSRSG